MKKEILSVLAGVITGIIVVMAGDFIAHSVFTTPETIDYNDKEALKVMMANIPVAMYAMMLAFWCLSSFLGGLVAGKINPGAWKRSSLITGVMLMAAAITNLIMLPHPMWMVVATVLLYLPCAYAGGSMANRKRV